VSSPALSPARSLGERELARAVAALGAHFGLRFGAHNLEQLAEGLVRAAEAAQLPPAALVARLDEGAPEILQQVVQQVANRETYFFRHPEDFDGLTGRIASQLGGARPSVRAWSAGCATGEEAYSLAIALGRVVPEGRVQVVGTDVNRAALAIACGRRFGRWSQRGGAERMASAVTSHPDGSVEIRPEVAGRVRFEYLNLAAASYPQIVDEMDVIFCRNVLVYLLPEVAAQVVERLAARLAPGGYLVVSAIDVALAPTGLQAIGHGEATMLRRELPHAEGARRAVASPAAPSLAPAAPSLAAPVETPAGLAARAREAADRGALDEALALAGQLVTHERTPEALHLYALVLDENGRAEEAEALLAETIERAPRYVLGHLSLGLRQHKGPERRAHLSEVLRLIAERRDDEVLAGPEPLAVSWVRRLAQAGLESAAAEPPPGSKERT
jgi:chemotaxis protein methyltransferase CheR